MSNKLYVGRLADNTNTEDLNTFFSQVGDVISIELSEKITFQPNMGSAYVTMKSDTDAAKAVKELSNKNLKGSRVRVMTAHAIDQKGHTYFSYKRRRKSR